MRFMMLVKANKDSEAGVLPSKELVAEGLYASFPPEDAAREQALREDLQRKRSKE